MTAPAITTAPFRTIILAALLDAIAERTPQTDDCAGCGAALADRCEDHAEDAARVAEYERLLAGVNDAQTDEEVTAVICGRTETKNEHDGDVAALLSGRTGERTT